MRFEEEYMIRLCKPEDAETDVAVIAPFIQEMARDAGHPAPDDAALRDLLYSLLSTGFSEFLVAEVKNQPVGCLQINYRLSTWAAAPYAFIEDLYVQPDAQSLGIGRSMLDYACHRALARGCAYAELDTTPDNEKAIRLYKRMGFEQRPHILMRTALPRKGSCSGHSHEHEHEGENHE